MKPISSYWVEKTWRKMSAMSPNKAISLGQQLENKQPYAMTYLLAYGERENMNQDEKELLLYLGMVVWQMMLTGNHNLPTVSIDQIEQMEEKNLTMIDYLSAESENNFQEAILAIFDNYNQPEVLRYVVEALEEEDDDECDIRDEMKGAFFLPLKTIIDCFDQ
ncbi:hypothetical protein ACFL27_02945 [candidate division CSSED10-310 bacterium]|uniref:DUF4274 domain-containing protein n=1 Tax=candidate division CSSED10-310 bacterium TaxID=2855610 RepID=A0ABV6YSI6_UNCC1